MIRTLRKAREKHNCTKCSLAIIPGDTYTEHTYQDLGTKLFFVGSKHCGSCDPDDGSVKFLLDRSYGKKLTITLMDDILKRSGETS